MFIKLLPIVQNWNGVVKVKIYEVDTKIELYGAAMLT